MPDHSRKARPKMVPGGISVPYIFVASGKTSDNRRCHWLCTGETVLRTVSEPVLAFRVRHGNRSAYAGHQHVVDVFRAGDLLLSTHDMTPGNSYDSYGRRDRVTPEQLFDAIAWRESGVTWANGGGHPFAAAESPPFVRNAFHRGAWQASDPWRSRLAVEDDGHVIAQDNEAALREHIAAYGSRYVLWGDKVMYVANEPVWTVEAVMKGQVNVELTMQGRKWGLPPGVNNPATLVFGADQMADARAFAERAAEELYDGRCNEYGAVDILDPSAIQVDPRTESLALGILRASELFLKAQESRVLPGAVMAEVGRFKDAADAVRLISDASGRERAHRIEDVLFDWLPLWAGVEPHLEGVDFEGVRNGWSWANRFRSLLDAVRAADAMPSQVSTRRRLASPLDEVFANWRRLCSDHPELLDGLRDCRKAIEYAQSGFEPGYGIRPLADQAEEALASFSSCPGRQEWQHVQEVLKRLLSSQPDRYPSAAVAGGWGFTHRESLRSALEVVNGIDPFREPRSDDLADFEEPEGGDAPVPGM